MGTGLLEQEPKTGEAKGMETFLFAGVATLLLVILGGLTQPSRFGGRR